MARFFDDYTGRFVSRVYQRSAEFRRPESLCSVFLNNKNRYNAFLQYSTFNIRYSLLQSSYPSLTTPPAIALVYLDCIAAIIDLEKFIESMYLIE
jgi:hypothetical protein